MQTQDRLSEKVIAIYSLSTNQRRLWLTTEPAGLCAQCAVLVEGALNSETFRRAVELVVHRHEILRTTFNRQAGLKLPLPMAHESLGIDWREIDGARSQSITQDELAASILQQQASDPFDLEQGPTVRVTLSYIGRGRNLLAVTLPALCADAITLRNLIAEIGRAYSHLALGNEWDGEPLPYSEFSAWQNELGQADDQEAVKGRAYWASQNISAIAQTALKKPGTAAGIPRRTESHTFDLGTELTIQLEDVERRLDLSVRAILSACWNVLVSRLTGEMTVLVGEVFDGRQYEEFQDALGLYSQRVPVVWDLKAQQRFSSVARRLHDLQDKAIEWADYANFDESGNPTIGFEYTQWPSPILTTGLSFTFLRRLVNLDAFQLKLTCIRLQDRLQAELHFDPALLNETEAYLLEERLLALLRSVVANPGCVIGNLPTLGQTERRRIVCEYNDSEAVFQPGRTVHQLFEERVAERQDAVAVVCDDRHFTFDELNRRSNQVAHYLKAQGLAVEQRVALLTGRSENFLFGALGVLKAGGAYIPIDQACPRERIASQLMDAGATMILAEESLLKSLPDDAGLRPILFNDEEIAACRCQDPSPDVVEGNLAYVLFTSGSTGRPKGVAVEHRQLVNYINAISEKLTLPRGSHYATVSTFAADLGNTMIFPALCGGQCLHIVDQETAADPHAFGGYMRSRRIDCLKIVPSHLAALLLSERPEELLPCRLLVLGGEATPDSLVDLIRELAPDCRIMNHYGPSETTVGVTALEYREDAFETTPGSLPLGRPLANCKIYMLDANLHLAPINTPGEICLGGDCLARGYLARPDLTSEKFVPDPFGGRRGGRMYRTGDLARLRPNFTADFLGRIDNQVKIRGFRVELEEIETVLSANPDVWEAVVLVNGAAAQRQQLTAYVVTRRSSELSQSALKAYLAGVLPEYMVPSAIVFLDSLPLTPNGKVDREALRSFGQFDERDAPPAGAPGTAVELALAEIWAAVLGLPKVGLNDNFFDLGGDSILAIQVVARANRIGLRLTPKQIFDYQTIAEVATVVDTVTQVEAEQREVVEPVALTPIQRWFFEQNLIEPNHWNQSVLLEAPPELTPGLARAAVTRILEHHEALRMRFGQTPHGSWQSVAAVEEVDHSFVSIDLREAPEPDLSGKIEAAASEIQASLNLSEGPIARFALFDLGDAKPKRLLIVIHHLVVDGVSWRILLEDLETVCQQLLINEPISLPPSTCSFKQWARQLADYVESGGPQPELAYWLQLAESGPDYLPKDGGRPNTIATTQSIVCSLDSEETAITLQELPKIYGARVNEILLAAIARGIEFCTGSHSLLIDLEGHGREAVIADIDVSRTVGWFTTHFPVALDMSRAENSQGALKLVKEQLRKIPNNGIGYGLLRYLGKDQDVVENLRALPSPKVKFNYLGRFGQSIDQSSLFTLAKEPRGVERDPRSERTHLLDIDALVIGKQLHLRWSFSENVYSHAAILDLARVSIDELRTLIAQRGEEAPWHSPTDYPLARLDERSLERTVLTMTAHDNGSDSGNGKKRRRIEDIYPVSPLQESLLVHCLSNQGSGAGFEQKALLLSGDVDVGTFSRTWQTLVDRHPVLRTAFILDAAAGPLQIVLDSVEIPVEHMDWRETPPPEQKRRLDQYLREDFQRGFDPARAPLMRLALIRLSDDMYRVIWSYHHLLIDAWCRNLVLQEVFEIYDTLCNSRVSKLSERRPYRDYIAWLQRQDSASAELFWRELLRGFVTPTRLPIGRRVYSGSHNEEIYQTRTLQFSASETSAITSYAQSSRLTLNTLVHMAWALILSRYCGAEDVLFGTTVSGRPPGLPGADSMLGMFINNLPIRVRAPGTTRVLTALQNLQSLLASVREYEWVSPLKIQEWSEAPQSQRLTETLVVFQNYPLEGSVLGSSTGLEMQDLRSRFETSYPLTVVVGPFEPLAIRFFYDQRRFDQPGIDRLAEHLRGLLNSLALSGQSSVMRDLQMFTEAERYQLSHIYNDSGSPAGEKSCPHLLIEKQADLRPNEIAVKGGKEILTWRELNRRANLLAHRLVRAMVKSGDRIAVLLNRDTELPIGLLAVLKTGAAFIALDPSDSTDRISQRLKETNAQAVLTTESLGHAVRDSSIPLITVGGHQVEFAESDHNLHRKVSIKDPACLSSDGDSESHAEITQESIFDQAKSFASIVSPIASDSVLIAAPSNSLAALEILIALTANTRIVLPSVGAVSQPLSLSQALKDSEATIMQAPASVWQSLLKLGWEGGKEFKAICLGKRSLSRRTCRELSARTGCLWKIYTAGSTWRWVAFSRVQADSDDLRLIGSPIAGKKIHLLSGDLHPVPIGVTGEIWVSCDEDDRGRSRDSIVDPFDATEGDRFYRTGDLGRRGEDGRLEIRGRADRRIAFKDDLVDLDEVENALMGFPSLHDVAAIIWEHEDDVKSLGAYIVADFEAMPGTELLVDFAKTRLPRSAIPDFFIAMDSLPMTAAGDVNYEALPPPDLRIEVIWQEFCDPVQLRVKKIWEDLFGVEPIGIRDNFFELGGHSLLAVRLMGEIRKQFGRDLHLATLLKGATVEQLAEALRTEDDPSSWSPLVQIQSGDDSSPLFCVHAAGGEVLNYLELASCLGRGQSVFGLQARRFVDGKEGARRIEEMAACYLEAIRTVKPQGPYRIAGYSFGGIVAFEMARQLYADGERSTWLGILDTFMVDNLDVGQDPDQDPVELALDWPEHLLNFSRHGSSVTADDLRRLGSLEEMVSYAIEHGILPYNLDLTTAMRYAKAGEDTSIAKRRYVARPYSGRAHFFRASQGHVLDCPDPTLGWGSVIIGGLEIHDVPGAHWNMLVKPHVQVLAKKIRASLLS